MLTQQSSASNDTVLVDLPPSATAWSVESKNCDGEP